MRSSFQRLFYGMVTEVINQGYNLEGEMEYTKLFHDKTSDKAFEEFFTMAGSGLFSVVKEGQPVPRDQFYPGFRARVDHVEYGNSIGYSHKVIQDARVPYYNDRARDLGFSARQTKEVEISGFIDLGFPGGSVLTPDGLTLFNSAHLNERPGGATQSNLLATPGRPSVTTIRAVLIMFRRFFDNTGKRRIVLNPMDLVCPPENEFDALEALKSTDRPDTANRATNVVANKLNVVCYRYLVNQFRWAVLTNKSQHKLYVYNRNKLKTDEYENTETRMNYVRAILEFSKIAAHWLGAVGVNATS
jgi:hypothetical protein